MGIQSNKTCTKTDIIRKVQKVLNEMDNAKVESRCCCTDPARSEPGTKVVSASCLDGQPALLRKIPVSKEKYIWVPPPVDNRPPLDPSMSCYAATVAGQFYDQWKGCRLECESGGSGGTGGPHSHWWNQAKGQDSAPGSAGRSTPRDPDYCEDSSFVPPEPLGHQAWTNEPGGICRYPQYCKAHCFDHYPERDWKR